MKIPENVNYIIDKLGESGFLAYVVGGCVRDAIMGKEPKDWDIATSATPEKVKELFARTHDTGLKHGTVTVVIDHMQYEVTTFRIDGEYKDSRRPESVTYSTNIYDDLKRRDFTINAVAYNSKDGFIDPFNGFGDIKNRIIRGVGNPAERIKEDALRMLRALRFSASLGFTIHDDTKKAILNNSSLIDKISAERIRDELLAIIASPNTNVIFSDEFLSLMKNINAPLAESIEENKDCLSQMISTCKNKKLMRLSVLIYFLEEDSAGCFLNSLKLSNYAYNHVFKLHKANKEALGTDYYNVAQAIYKWGFDVFEDYLYIQMLNCVVNDLDTDYVTGIENHYNLIRENKLPVFIKDLNINGFDLNKEFNITGVSVGRALEGLLDYVHANPFNNCYEYLIKEAYSIITKSDVKPYTDRSSRLLL